MNTQCAKKLKLSFQSEFEGSIEAIRSLETKIKGKSDEKMRFITMIKVNIINYYMFHYMQLKSMFNFF